MRPADQIPVTVLISRHDHTYLRQVALEEDRTVSWLFRAAMNERLATQGRRPLTALRYQRVRRDRP